MLYIQKYLAVNQSSWAADSVELGATIAEQFGKAIGPVQRQLSTVLFTFNET
jgi:phosphatidylinositol 4-kinase